MADNDKIQAQPPVNSANEATQKLPDLSKASGSTKGAGRYQNPDLSHIPEIDISSESTQELFSAKSAPVPASVSEDVPAPAGKSVPALEDVPEIEPESAVASNSATESAPVTEPAPEPERKKKRSGFFGKKNKGDTSKKDEKPKDKSSDRPSVADKKPLFGRKKNIDQDVEESSDTLEDGQNANSDNLERAESTDGATGSGAVESAEGIEGADGAEGAENDTESAADNDADSSSKTKPSIRKDGESSSGKKKRNKPPLRFGVIIKRALMVCLIVLVGLSIFGIWNRWFRYNDVQDFQGNWQVLTNAASLGASQTQGNTGSATTTKPVVIKIDGKNIYVAENVTLSYELDTFSKVVNYKIGKMVGQSHYRFSWDRSEMALVESGGMDGLSTMTSDLGWFFDSITTSMSGVTISPAYTVEQGENEDTENTGVSDIIVNGSDKSVLLKKVVS